MRPVPNLFRIGQFWLLLLAVCVASLSPLPPGTLRGGLDKVAHLVTYLVLFVSLDYALACGRRLAAKLVLLLFFSWLVEIAQHFLPPRQYSMGDLLANLIGLLLGLLSVSFLRRTTGA
jgi:VanZ family protein